MMDCENQKLVVSSGLEYDRLIGLRGIVKTIVDRNDCA